jgi:hypothetical protein
MVLEKPKLIFRDHRRRGQSDRTVLTSDDERSARKLLTQRQASLRVRQLDLLHEFFRSSSFIIMNPTNVGNGSGGHIPHIVDQQFKELGLRLDEERRNICFPPLFPISPLHLERWAKCDGHNDCLPPVTRFGA